MAYVIEQLVACGHDLVACLWILWKRGIRFKELAGGKCTVASFTFKIFFQEV